MAAFRVWAEWGTRGVSVAEHPEDRAGGLMATAREAVTLSSDLAAPEGTPTLLSTWAGTAVPVVEAAHP